MDGLHDLDGDGAEKKVLRGTYNEVEVVLVLDTDDNMENALDF